MQSRRVSKADRETVGHSWSDAPILSVAGPNRNRARCLHDHGWHLFFSIYAFPHLCHRHPTQACEAALARVDGSDTDIGGDPATLKRSVAETLPNLQHEITERLFSIKLDCERLTEKVPSVALCVPLPLFCQDFF